MENVKLAIIFYSMTGNNLQMALWAREAAEAAGAQVRLRKAKELAPAAAVESNPLWRATAEWMADIAEAAPGDLEWADAVLFSSPSRFGNLASQLKQFIDLNGGLWAQGKLADKVVSGMATAQNAHGGQEQTILQLYTTMYHWGAIVVAPGYTDQSLFAAGGNPYGTSATVSRDGLANAELVKQAV